MEQIWKKHKKKEHEITNEEGNKEGKNTDKDGKLVQEEEYDEIVNNNIVVENREPIIETLITEKILIENIEIEGTLECDMKLIEEKYKLDQITEESLKNNRNIMSNSDRTSLELIKYFQIERIKIKNQQEGRFIPSGKVYMIQKGTDPVFCRALLCINTATLGESLELTASI